MKRLGLSEVWRQSCVLVSVALRVPADGLVDEGVTPGGIEKGNLWSLGRLGEVLGLSTPLGVLIEKDGMLRGNLGFGIVAILEF